ncbi:MAG: hypothetical protein RLO21_06705 [Nitratireductor sp.]
MADIDPNAISEIDLPDYHSRPEISFVHPRPARRSIREVARPGIAAIT